MNIRFEKLKFIVMWHNLSLFYGIASWLSSCFIKIKINYIEIKEGPIQDQTRIYSLFFNDSSEVLANSKLSFSPMTMKFLI